VKNKTCVGFTQNWYAFTLLNGVPLVGAMDFSDGESTPLEPGQWIPFPGEFLPLGILTFYLFGERYFLICST
jgi:hypothetical protein